MRAVPRPPLPATPGDLRRDPPTPRPPRRREPRGGWWLRGPTRSRGFGPAGLLALLAAASLPATGLSPGTSLRAQEIGISLGGARSETLADPLGGTLQVTFRGDDRVALRVGYTFLQGSERTTFVPICPDFVHCLTVIPLEARMEARVQQAALSAPITLAWGERATLRLVPGIDLDLLAMESRSEFPVARWSRRQVMWGGSVGVEAGVRPLAGHPVEIRAAATRGALRAITEGMADGRHYPSVSLTQVTVGLAWTR